VQPSFVPLPPAKVKRGGALRFLLLLCALASVGGSLAGVVSVATGHDDDSLGPSALPRRVLMLSLCGLMNVGFTAGVWGWRRWGVYGIVVVSLFAFMLNFRIGGAVLAVPGVIGPALLVVVAALQWGELE
jgi:hypothetical protein